MLLMPVAARRQLNELPDELWTKINIEFYSESADTFQGPGRVNTSQRKSRKIGGERERPSIPKTD